MVTVTSTEIFSLQQQYFTFMLRSKPLLSYSLLYRTGTAAFCTVESTTLPFVLTDSFSYSGYKKNTTLTGGLSRFSSSLYMTYALNQNSEISTVGIILGRQSRWETTRGCEKTLIRSPFWVLDFLLPGRLSCVSCLRCLDCPGGWRAVVFHEIIPILLSSRKEGCQSSFFSSVFIDCPGGIEGSRFL